MHIPILNTTNQRDECPDEIENLEARKMKQNLLIKTLNHLPPRKVFRLALVAALLVLALAPQIEGLCGALRRERQVEPWLGHQETAASDAQRFGERSRYVAEVVCDVAHGDPVEAGVFER